MNKINQLSVTTLQNNNLQCNNDAIVSRNYFFSNFHYLT